MLEVPEVPEVYEVPEAPEVPEVPKVPGFFHTSSTHRNEKDSRGGSLFRLRRLTTQTGTK